MPAPDFATRQCVERDEEAAVAAESVDPLHRPVGLVHAVTNTGDALKDEPLPVERRRVCGDARVAGDGGTPLELPLVDVLDRDLLVEVRREVDVPDQVPESGYLYLYESFGTC